jgi:hypothetical protein
MQLYVIEQVPEDSPESFHRKWNKKHRHHHSIAAATTAYIPRFAPTPHEWQAAVQEFLVWYDSVQLTEGDFFVLVFSVHGVPNSKGIFFDEKPELPTWDAVGFLHKRLRKDIVVIRSSCWGCYPDISLFMNHPDRGPVFTFGPTMAVNVGALHNAEREVLKFLATGGFGNNARAVSLIDQINQYGKRSPYKGHENFYRVCYFEKGNLQRKPGCLTTKPFTRNEN